MVLVSPYSYILHIDWGNLLCKNFVENLSTVIYDRVHEIRRTHQIITRVFCHISGHVVAFVFLLKQLIKESLFQN